MADEETALLRQEIARLTQANQELQQLVANRSVHVVGAFIDGLRAILNGAAQGDPAAHSNVRELLELLGRAQAVAKGIEPVNGIMVPAGTTRRKQH